MKHASIIAIVSLAAVLSACGQGDSAPNTSAAAPAAAPAEPATPTTAPVAAEPLAGVPTPPATQALADAAVVATAATAGAEDAGKAIYDKTCALCHAAGVAGAPLPDSKEHWAARMAQGRDTLYKHAVEGYTGQAGMMPPRGGNPTLSDDEVKAAVDYMVGKSS